MATTTTRVSTDVRFSHIKNQFVPQTNHVSTDVRFTQIQPGKLRFCNTVSQFLKNDQVRLFSELQNIPPDKAAVMTDMSGTLLEIPRGITSAQAQNLKDYLARGGFLAIVTGDSMQTVDDMLIKLGQVLGQNHKPYYIISGNGYQLIKIENGKKSAIAVGQAVSLEERKKIVEIINGVLPENLRIKDFSANSELFKAEGEMKELKSATFYTQFRVNPRLIDPKPVFFEVRPSHVLLGITPNDEKWPEILEKVNTALIPYAQGQGLYLDYSRNNYIAISKYTKAQGVGELLTKSEVKAALKGKSILSIGDSENDRTLLGYPWETFSNKVLRVYVGKDQQCSAMLRQASPNAPATFFHLPGKTLSTSAIFQNLKA
jgi:hydroxymethylpyrimidine pyrophosphatase-like HAD family hydrolase